jgi:hypothetical protein
VPDVLIRDVPEDVLAVIDEHAARLGLSRSAYLRRTLAREASASIGNVTAQDLRRFAERFPGLADPDAMRGAWE